MNTLRVYLKTSKEVPEPMGNAQNLLLISGTLNWSWWFYYKRINYLNGCGMKLTMKAVSEI